MNVLFVVWELDPFFKMGGLGDVARSLPSALKSLGINISIVLPYYKVVKMGRNKKTKAAEFQMPYAGKNEKVEVWKTTHAYTNVPAYFLKNPRYLDRVISMDTWGFFDKAVVMLIKNHVLSPVPDIVHLNDLHCGLIPLLLKLHKIQIPTLLTIHNIAYQGKTSTEVIKNMGIDPQDCKMLLWEIKSSQVNFLLEGIVHADIVTTVSPSYSKEIFTEEFGGGLNEVLKGKEARIFGILNGIDINWRYILQDRSVKYHYGLSSNNNGGAKYYDWQEGKRRNKLFLQKKLGLKVKGDMPMLSFIGRFDSKQKGLDILHTMLRRIDQTAYEFVILGSGEKNWEERFQWLSTFYPKNISCTFRYDEALAHQIYAASDFMIIPSRYEPCGLIQMISMLFGAIPIAHKTGGLKDSIKDSYNGFLFSAYNSEALEQRVTKAIDIWKNHRSDFEDMVQNALTTDFSWTKSAKEYISLYNKLLTETVWTS